MYLQHASVTHQFHGMHEGCERFGVGQVGVSPPLQQVVGESEVLAVQGKDEGGGLVVGVALPVLRVLQTPVAYCLGAKHIHQQRVVKPLVDVNLLLQQLLQPVPGEQQKHSLW